MTALTGGGRSTGSGQDATIARAGAAVRRWLRARLWLVCVVAFIGFVYTLYASAGGLKKWPVYGTYHDLQAEGFRAGTLSLPIAVAPELLRAKNPYDRRYSRYWALDASYYKGKYYTYWGPVPAVIQAVAKSALGIRKIVGDAYLTLFHLFIGAWAGALVIERLASRLFGGVSRPLLILTILAFAFANPALHAATTGGTYNAAIIAAQGWLLVGLVPAFDAVWWGGGRRATRWRLVLAGCALALALGSRVTVVPSIAVVIAATALAEAWGTRERWLRAFWNALCVGLPVLVMGLALLTYNKLRFEDWFEFGSKVQTGAYPIEMSLSWVVPNLYTYTFRPFVLACEFPYVFQVWWMNAADAFPSGYQIPAKYMILEPVIGWVLGAPMTWLIPLLLFVRPSPFPGTRRRATYAWGIVSFAAIGTLTILVALAFYSATMRYMADFMNGLMLLSVLALFAVRKGRLGRVAPRAVSSVLGLLAAATLVLGCLIGYQGYGGQFEHFNPKLHRKINSVLSLCGDEKPVLPKFKPW